MKISPAHKQSLRDSAVLSLLQVGLVVAFAFSLLDVQAEEPIRNASAKDHWAFRVPVRPELASTKHADEARSAIDRIVWARLEAEGLAPAQSADRYALIRRLSLDLTGLPPSIEEVDAFVNDPAPDAYERVVDRLLASSRYGERWGLWWLDLARYADSNGYESDRARSIWPWRDWVIEAFNADMPFDQFTIEQVAGDMLPDATLAQRIATGFHRNTWINEEGGHDWEQFRYESVVDRVHTTGTVFLGLTLACAQCHDHKYDPISQREYFQLFAFLNNADEPDLWVPGSEIRRRQEEIDIEIAERIADRAAHFPPLPTPAGAVNVDAEIANFSDAQSRQLHLDQTFSAWLDQPPNRPLAWNLLDPVTATSQGNATMTELDDRSILVTGDRPEVDKYEVVYKTDARRISGFRLEAIPDARLPYTGPGRGSFMGDGSFVVTEFRVDLVKEGARKSIEFAKAYASHHSREYTIEKAIDGNKLTSWFIGGGGAGKRHVAVFEASRPYELEVGTRIQVTILQNFVHQQTLGRFRLFVTGDEAPLHSDLRPVSLDALMDKSPELRTGEERTILRDYFLSVAPTLKPYNEEIQKLRDARPRFPTTFVFREREDALKRATHIHVRGEFRRPGEEVAAAVPSVLHPFPEDRPRNRLTFAEWLVNDGNPLIGRVIANQLWQAFFGRGIVSTPENFGVQGASPSHPELLDWLAVEFRTGGWSLKSLHRQIVTSAVYRQASRVSSELLKRDPENVLLARSPRLRLDAETIRDMALEASGLLVGTLGGPSVFPPQPAEVGKTFGGFRWKDSTGAARYRRGLYTFRKRSGPYAAFATFDAPPPDTCAMSRSRSNTPLQALAQLNDLVVIEASRALAARVLRAGSADLSARIRHAFRLVLTRPPDKKELGALVEFHERQRERFESGSLDAAAVYGADSGPAELQDLAAMTTVARLLLNLDEAINKE